MSAIIGVNSDLKVKVSRFMSHLLRHNPGGLQMDERGFVRLDDLLRRVRARYEVMRLSSETKRVLQGK